MDNNLDKNLNNRMNEKDIKDDEIKRQNYYMELCKEWVSKKSEELGRPLTCTAKTFGCPIV